MGSSLTLCGRLLFCVVVGTTLAGCGAEEQDAIGEGGFTMSATATLEPGKPGERWGDFIFQDPASPVSYTVTPRASGPVLMEEAIPSNHPGTRLFQSAAELSQVKSLPAGSVREPTVPPQYELIGGYYVELDDGRVTDLSFSYRLRGRVYRGTADEVFAPQLAVGWTTRASRPLPASTVGSQAAGGRIGLRRVKVEVLGVKGVLAEWLNPDSIPDELKVPSGLNWFDSVGRLWYVQGVEEAAVLLKVAESLGPME